MFTCRQDSMSNELDYVELGLSCADICKSLMNGRRLDEFSQFMRDAFNQLMT